MSGTIRVEAGELPPEEIIEALEEGRRIVIETEVLGSPHTVTLRYDGETYYCDTPTTLHTHDDVDEMDQCIRDQGYADVD